MVRLSDTVTYVPGNYFPTDFCQFALQTSHTRFTRIVTNNIHHRGVIHGQLVRLQAIGFALLWQQIFERNIDFFLFGITGNPDNLETIQQRAGDIHRVCRTDEHDFGKVVIDFQIVVVEAVILLGVEHFQHR